MTLEAKAPHHGARQLRSHGERMASHQLPASQKGLNCVLSPAGRSCDRSFEWQLLFPPGHAQNCSEEQTSSSGGMSSPARFSSSWQPLAAPAAS